MSFNNTKANIILQNAKNVKQYLNKAISQCNKSKGIVCPEKDFTRNRVFTLETMQRCIHGMGGQSLNKELYSYFNKYGVTEPVQAKKSAFVQQRNKIKPELTAVNQLLLGVQTA